MLYFTVLLPGPITHTTRNTQWSAPCLCLITTPHMLSFSVFCFGPGSQAKCTTHPQMPSAAPHPSTIPTGSCTLYRILPSISNKHLQVFSMMSPLPRCISALFLLLEINRQCTPQKNISFSPAITWKIEVHLSFVVIDIYAEDKECNTHSCMVTHIKQPTYKCYCMFHAVVKLRTSITHSECIVLQAVNIGILTFNVSANAWYCEAEKVKQYGQAIRQDNLGSRDGQ